MDDAIEEDLRIASRIDRWSDNSSYRAAVTRPHIRSILVIKVDHIGDFILSLDAIIALHRAFPDAHFDLVCGPWNVELADSLGLFEHILPIEFFNARADGDHPTFHPDMVTSLRGRHYDLAIDLRIDPDTRVILRYVSATYKVGFDAASENSILTMFLPHYYPAGFDTNVGIHQTMLMLRLARSTADLFHMTNDVKSLLLERVSRQSTIDLSMARDRILVACNTTSGRAIKNWPIDRYRRLLRWLANDLDLVVLLLGGGDQLDETADIIQFCGSNNVISAVAKTSIGQAIDLISQASLFIGNDSGLTHVAARLGVPTVALFSGADRPMMWGALGEQVIILRSEVTCAPCHILKLSDCRGSHSCMLNITEAAVRSAVRTHLFTARTFGRTNRSLPLTVSDLPNVQDPGRDATFSEWTCSPQAQVPQRYSDNHPRYIAQGGQLRIEQLLKGFTANNRNNRGDLNRFYTLVLIFDQIIKEQLAGDVAELGVYKGNTACMLADLARQIGSTAYLLDTFEGFASSDMQGVDANERMEFADTSLEQVQALVGTASTRYVKGFFPDTANQIPDEARFCLVHIDCDLYAPFKHALAFFYERMIPGGFLVMHDYSSLRWDGAERAIDEFFADKPESILPVADGSGTVVVRKLKPANRSDNWFVHSKSAGFANAWVQANIPSVSDFLASGWSSPEAWGTWGIGASHVLSMTLLHVPPGDLELAVESLAVLLPGRERQTIDVIGGGETLTTWEYDPERNSGVRLVRIPREKIDFEDGLPVLRVEFRPASSASPHELDPANPDNRQLGLGLIRFRQRQL
jgi:ADP-heptose:LPS heptosyltransferase